MSVLVQGALNGSGAPMAPVALAREARAACDAEARSPHLHPYEGDGRESMAGAAVASAITATN
jgi:uncharacterized protein (DUF849 family)